MELEQKLADIRALGLGVAAISYDSPAVLKNFAERRSITYPLLSDEGSRVIKAFGILNEEVPAGTQFAGIPHPGTYILDPQGSVTAKYFEEDFTQRFTAADILVKQFGAKAGAAHATAQTKHLRLSTSATTGHVRSGQRIALTIDIEMMPGMHVYAPGVEGYIPIAWTLQANEAIVVHDLVVPPSKTMRLEAINETVPVYTGSFRLVRDVTIGKDQKLRPLNGELPIEGVLKYQACDERMCYNPQTVPVKWTLHIDQHDRERAPADLQRKAK